MLWKPKVRLPSLVVISGQAGQAKGMRRIIPPTTSWFVSASPGLDPLIESASIFQNLATSARFSCEPTPCQETFFAKNSSPARSCSDAINSLVFSFAY